MLRPSSTLMLILVVGGCVIGDQDADDTAEPEVSLFTGGDLTATYGFTGSANSYDCDVEHELEVIGDVPAGCPSCTYTGTLLVDFVNHDCDFSGLENLSAPETVWDGLEYDVGVDLGAEVAYQYVDGTWRLLTSEGATVFFGPGNVVQATFENEFSTADVSGTITTRFKVEW